MGERGNRELAVLNLNLDVDLAAAALTLASVGAVLERGRGKVDGLGGLPLNLGDLDHDVLSGEGIGGNLDVHALLLGGQLATGDTAEGKREGDVATAARIIAGDAEDVGARVVTGAVQVRHDVAVDVEHLGVGVDAHATVALGHVVGRHVHGAGLVHVEPGVVDVVVLGSELVDLGNLDGIEVGHVVQVGADAHSGLDAVTGAVVAHVGGVAKSVLAEAHLHVVGSAEATGGEHDALAGLNANLAVGGGGYDTNHRTVLAQDEILESAVELRGDGALLDLGVDALMQRVEELGAGVGSTVVGVSPVRTGHSLFLCNAELLVLAAHGVEAARGHAVAVVARRLVVLGALVLGGPLDLEELVAAVGLAQITDPVDVLAGHVGISADDLLGAEVVVLVDTGVDPVKEGVGAVGHAEGLLHLGASTHDGATAASHGTAGKGGLLDDEDLRTVVGSLDGARRAGRAVAADENLALLVPNLLGSLVGESHTGKTGACQCRTGACDETTTGHLGVAHVEWSFPYI